MSNTPHLGHPHHSSLKAVAHRHAAGNGSIDRLRKKKNRKTGAAAPAPRCHRRHRRTDFSLTSRPTLHLFPLLTAKHPTSEGRVRERIRVGRPPCLHSLLWPAEPRRVSPAQARAVQGRGLRQLGNSRRLAAWLGLTAPMVVSARILSGWLAATARLRGTRESTPPPTPLSLAPRR